MSRGLAWSLLIAACGASLFGCGGSGLDLAPVEGVVTLDGQPVEKAAVLFTPERAGAGPSASGTTNARGEFRLTTANQPGAPLGEHVVLISKTERPEPPRDAQGRIDEQQMLLTAAAEPTYVIPRKYSNRAEPLLRATVEPRQNNHFTFSLTSDAPAERAADEAPSHDDSAN